MDVINSKGITRWTGICAKGKGGGGLDTGNTAI